MKKTNEEKVKIIKKAYLCHSISSHLHLNCPLSPGQICRPYTACDIISFITTL